MFYCHIKNIYNFSNSTIAFKFSIIAKIIVSHLSKLQSFNNQVSEASLFIYTHKNTIIHISNIYKLFLLFKIPLNKKVKNNKKK